MKINLNQSKYLLNHNHRRWLTVLIILIYATLAGSYVLLPRWEIYSKLKATEQQYLQTKALYAAELQEKQLNTGQALEIIKDHEPITAISNAVSLAAASAQVRVLTLTPEKVQQRNEIYFQPVRLELEGKYHPIVAFMQQLHAAHQQILMQNFTLTKITAQQQELLLKLQIEYPYV